MADQKPYILWLCSWYPNQTEPLDGDFIQRHAQAAALYENIKLLFVVRDKTGKITRDILIEKKESKNLTETVVYYYSPDYPFSIAGKFLSHLKYKKVFKKQIAGCLAEYGKPRLVHVHAGMKAGLLAQWLKRKENIPYVVTEHWAGFLPEANSRFESLSFYLRRSWRRLINDAFAVSAVSGYLATHLHRVFGKNVPVTVIPNVVNTHIFYPERKDNGSVTELIHVSRLDYQKNPEAIIEASAIVKNKGFLFHLSVFGPVIDALKNRSEEAGLARFISFYKEVPQPELAGFIRQSDGLILYSRYETFGCVLIEANAAGVPVIASDIPVIQEIIKSGENGMLAETENPAALANAVIEFINKRNEFCRDTIAEETAKKYSYAVVGKKLSDWYNRLLNKQL